MNYAKDKPTDNHFKQAMCAENIEKFRKLFQKFEEFVSHITVDEPNKSSKKRKNTGFTRKPVLKSTSAAGFIGFLVNIQSTLGIYA